MTDGSFVIVVPAGPDELDIGVPHVVREPDGDEAVALTATVSTMRMSTRAAIALLIQLQTGLINLKGIEWWDKCRLMGIGTGDTEPKILDTLEIAKAWRTLADLRGQSLADDPLLRYSFEPLLPGDPED